MKLIGLTVLALLGLGFAPAGAQLATTHAGNGAPGFQGAGDVVGGAAAWVGLEAYSVAYAAGGGKSVNVCNASDVACVDLTFGANGHLSNCNTVTCTVGASDCNSISCTVKTAYDQSGAGNCGGLCNFTQATIGLRPTLLVNCQNGQPCMVFAGGSSQCLTATGYVGTTAQPYSISAVGIRTSGVATSDWLATMPAGQGSTNSFVGTTTANNFGTNAGNTANVSATDNVLHSVNATLNGISTATLIDGTDHTGQSVGTNAIGATMQIGCTQTNFNFLTGHINEIGIWALGFTPAQRANLNTNQHGTLRWNF